MVVEAERQSAGPIVIIDMDPMGSPAAWWNERAADTPVYADISKVGLTQTLRALEQSGIKSILIDTPPFATSEIASALLQTEDKGCMTTPIDNTDGFE